MRRRASGLALALAGLVAAGCASADTRTEAASGGGIFDYPSGPLDVREAGVQRFDGYSVHDISYASPVRGRVTAYLVLPDGPGPFPAVIWEPGLNGGRNDQLADATALASKGAASLLIDPPHVRAGGPTLITCTQRDRRPFIQYVVEVRRGIDVLSSRPEIDRNRIGDVGFSFGSTIAGVLSGVDRRLHAVVIESGRAYHTGYLRTACSTTPKRKLRVYLRQLAFTNPIRYVPHAAPTPLLIQNGRRDPFTPRREALALQRAASQPKTVRWYLGGHELTASAYADRDRFLERALDFGGVARASAAGRLELSYTVKGPRDRWPHLWLSAPDGSRERKLENRPGDKQKADWTADGKRVAFRWVRSGGRSDLVVMNADGSGWVNLTRRTGLHGLSPSWSPDGSHLVVAGTRADGDGVALYVMRPDGTDVRKITSGFGESQYPAWSPDGRSIAFTRVSRDGGFDIYSVRPDGSHLMRLTSAEGYDEWPMWSPDSRRIAFGRENGSGAGIWIMNRDGSGKRFVTGRWAAGVPGSWAPSSLLTFQCRRPQTPRVISVCARNPDGGPIRVLLKGIDAGFPSWRRSPGRS